MLKARATRPNVLCAAGEWESLAVSMTDHMWRRALACVLKARHSRGGCATKRQILFVSRHFFLGAQD